MIHIVDNFVDKDLFKIANDYLNNGKFITHTVGEKNFYIQESPESFNNYVLRKLGMIEGRELENILSFFRVSTDELDTQWRIHSDLKIKGEHPDRAVVLYMSERELEELHGTAFWEHDVYGKSLPAHVKEEEYDEMIRVDAEQLEKWRLVSVVGYEPNRLISYPANYFHSKYPNKSWKEGREVFVMFYKYKNNEEKK
tara:strand:+ start:2213 stop:2803 length:591 start_codon:yes stop_codon:yes gene_type:complete